MHLFHVSEDPTISRFEPREPTNSDAGVRGPAVWAVDEARLRNYLLPRDCPRVTFYARPSRLAAAHDEPLLSGTTASRVIAVESAWLAGIRTTSLFCYELDAAGFACRRERRVLCLARSGHAAARAAHR